jgi:hypothetical protein
MLVVLNFIFFPYEITKILYTMFVLGEIGKREVGEREIEERCYTSLVWFGKKWKREITFMWVPSVFSFFAQLRRKREET